MSNQYCPAPEADFSPMPAPTHVFCTGLGATYITNNDIAVPGGEPTLTRAGVVLYAMRYDLDVGDGLLLGWREISEMPEGWLEQALADHDCTKVWENFDYRVQIVTRSDSASIINTHDDPVYAMEGAFNLQMLVMPVRVSPVRIVPCFDIWQAYYINHPMYATEIPEDEVLWSHDFFEFVGDELVRAGVEDFLSLIAQAFGDGDEIGARLVRLDTPGVEAVRSTTEPYFFTVDTSKHGSGMVRIGPCVPKDSTGLPLENDWVGERDAVAKALVSAINSSNVCYAKEAIITCKHYPNRENWEYKQFEYAGTGGTHEYIINRAGNRVEKLSIPDLLHKMV